MNQVPKELLAIATRSLFRLNPFRVLQVSVLADSKELRQAELFLRMAERGIRPDNGNKTNTLALDPPPTQMDAQTAFHALSDPLHRFLWEFFWLWPDDYLEKIGFTGENAGRLVHSHNEPIRLITEFMDLDATTQEQDWDPDTMLDLARKLETALWWLLPLSDEASLEDVLLCRIRQIDDPRITTGWARRLKECYLPFVGAFFTRVIAYNIELNFLAKATFYASWMKHYKQTEYLLREELILAYGKIEKEILSFIEDIEHTQCSDPEEKINIFKHWLVQNKEKLDLLKDIFGKNDSYTLNLTDKVVFAFFDTSVDYGRKYQQWQNCLNDINFNIEQYCYSDKAVSRLKDSRQQLNSLINKEGRENVIKGLMKAVSNADEDCKKNPKAGLDLCDVILSLFDMTLLQIEQTGISEEEKTDLRNLIGVKITSYVIDYWNAVSAKEVDVPRCVLLLVKVTDWITEEKGKAWHKKNLEECQQALIVHFIRHAEAYNPPNPPADQQPKPTPPPKQQAPQAGNARPTPPRPAAPAPNNNPAPPAESWFERNRKDVWIMGSIVVVTGIAALWSWAVSESKGPTPRPPRTPERPAWTNYNPDSIPGAQQTAVPSPTTAISPEPSPEVPFPSHGTSKFFIEGNRIAGLKINTPYSRNYFVKLEEASTGRKVAVFFLQGGQPFETKVPLGQFVMKYAAGASWYGEKLKFGPSTEAKKFDTIMDFSYSGNYILGHEVTFSLVRNGNLRSTNINPSDI